MFPQESWGIKPFNSYSKNKTKRLYCNGTHEDQIITLFKCNPCYCSKWNSTQHHVILPFFFPSHFSSTILSYFRQTSVFRMTTGLSCTQARCDQDSGHWQAVVLSLSSSRCQDTFHFLAAAIYNSSATPCSTARWRCCNSLIHQGAWLVVHGATRYHWLSTKVIQKDAWNCDTFHFWRKQSSVSVVATPPWTPCHILDIIHLFAWNMDMMSAISKIEYTFSFFSLFPPLLFVLSLW